MASRGDDDFVFTIDDDDIVSDGGEAENSLDGTAKLAGQGKKRKFTEDTTGDIRTRPASSKKAKQSKKGKRSDKVRIAATEGEDETVAAISDTYPDSEDHNDIASDFEFTAGDIDTGFVEEFDGWGVEIASGVKEQSLGSKSTAVDVDEIIERRRRKKSLQASENSEPDLTEDRESEHSDDGGFEGFEDDDEFLAEDGFGMGIESDEDDNEDEIKGGEDGDSAENDGTTEESDADDDEVAVPVPHPMDLEAGEDDEDDEDDAADAVEAQKAADFFAAPEEEDSRKSKKTPSTGSGSFQGMSLSRPILRGLAAVGFSEATPIQAKTIPVAMEGKDVVGGAVTGSGKTAAFLIPILERLLYRPKKIPTTRVAIFMPTRELAVQCFNVAQKLAAFTDVTFALMVGGFSSREQEAVLRTKPDVVIATPGRFIDHMRNSAGFEVESLEILVLDEADRMLEEGFESQLNEILTTIPKSRQTMLFSATMTSSVDKLIQLGMNRPVRLMVNAKKQTVAGLTQEFVRLRQGREGKRLAYLMSLCTNVYTDRVIIFFRQKKEAHRVRIIFSLCGLKSSELHGNMSQEQRIQSVESFRSGKSAYLLATDVASRGLDIKNVSTVINYEAPQTHEIYLHRVGRTARAGRIGRSCTIAAEPDRKIVKEAVKSARAQGAKVVSRQVPQDEVDSWISKLDNLESEIEEVILEEREERALSITDRDLKRGENMIVYENEIKSRPKRTWFESGKAKEEAKAKGAAELNGPAEKKEKKKLSGKDKKKLELRDARNEGKVWKKGKEERSNKVPSGKKDFKAPQKSKPKNTGKGSRR